MKDGVVRAGESKPRLAVLTTPAERSLLTPDDRNDTFALLKISFCYSYLQLLNITPPGDPHAHIDANTAEE